MTTEIVAVRRGRERRWLHRWLHASVEGATRSAVEARPPRERSPYNEKRYVREVEWGRTGWAPLEGAVPAWEQIGRHGDALLNDEVALYENIQRRNGVGDISSRRLFGPFVLGYTATQYPALYANVQRDQAAASGPQPGMYGLSEIQAAVAQAEIAQAGASVSQFSQALLARFSS